jgi:hypothetical protein
MSAVDFGGDLLREMGVCNRVGDSEIAGVGLGQRIRESARGAGWECVAPKE